MFWRCHGAPRTTRFILGLAYTSGLAYTTRDQKTTLHAGLKGRPALLPCGLLPALGQHGDIQLWGGEECLHGTICSFLLGILHYKQLPALTP